MHTGLHITEYTMKIDAFQFLFKHRQTDCYFPPTYNGEKNPNLLRFFQIVPNLRFITAIS